MYIYIYIISSSSSSIYIYIYIVLALAGLVGVVEALAGEGRLGQVHADLWKRKRARSNAETRSNRINTMLRPTQFTDESSVNAHQGSNPTQFTDESSVTFHQDTQVVNISDTMCPGRADSGRRTHKA